MAKRRMYLPAEAHELIFGFDQTLSAADFDDYQKWMAKTLLSHKRVLLGAFMGSGKTAVGLYCVRRLIRKNIVRRALVVAPYHVAEDTWPTELMTWTFGRKLSYSVLMGTEDERETARLERTDLHIINRENLKWLLQRWGKRAWPYELVIYDEASRLKSGRFRTRRTQRKDGSWSKGGRDSEFKTAHVVAGLRQVQGFWEFSGTPASNGLIDLWGPIAVLDGGERLGYTRSQFKERWFIEDAYTYDIEPRPGAEEEITSKIKDLFFCLKEEDYVRDLPPVIVRDRWVSLSDRVMSMYYDFERELVLEKYDIEAVNKGVLCNKLLQFANGSVYDEEGEDQFVHNRKIKELESVVEEAAGRPLLIAYSFQFDKKAILKRFPHFRVYGESKTDMRDWNQGRIPGLLIHPASAGHGLNFQHGGNIAVWFGLNWSLELYQQFNKRLHRRGQKADHFFLYRILARDTNDERVARVLEERDVTQNRITNVFRVRVDELRAKVGR